MKTIIKIIGFLFSLSSVISYANQGYTTSNHQQGYTSSNQQINQPSSTSSSTLNNLGPAYKSSKRTTPNQTLHAARLPTYYNSSGNSGVNTYSSSGTGGDNTYSSSGNSGVNTYSNAGHRHNHKHHSGHFSFGVTTFAPPAPVFYMNRVDTYYVPAAPTFAHNILWVEGAANLPVPQDVVLGGGDQYNSYPICRAFHKGTYHPGKLVDHRCHISYGGQELSYYRYQILTSQYPLSWVPDSNGHVPAGALFTGREHGYPLYVCQAPWQGTMQPGKVVGNMCNIAFQGQEFGLTHYNVLIA